jgi:L-alanine-DL-glutamate epimerase-like enolase superfamily enzyme
MIAAQLIGMTFQALEVPLIDPFVIATATMTHTRAALLEVRLRGSDGREARGWGEAATLYPVTHEDLPDLLVLAAACARELRRAERTLASPEDCEALAAEVCQGSAVLAAALDCALLDALARLAGCDVRTLFGVPVEAREFESDVTIPIAETTELLRIAQSWYARGFRALKAKVGRDVEQETAGLVALASALPDVTLRLDANAGFSADAALHMMHEFRSRGVRVACFEQPCAREDLEGMARVCRDAAVDVVADESLRSEADLAALIEARAATSVNLKLVKLRSFGVAKRIGQRALEAGLGIMVGGMVETRVGMNAAAMLAASLREVRYADLDTAWLLADDRFLGGFHSDGPRLRVVPGLGFGVTPKATAEPGEP